jgi:cation-transporting P-type ATPase C
MIVLANAVRPSAKDLMTAFRRDGIGLCCLISGDAGPVVERMHKELGFDTFRADCLPEEKAAFLEELGSKGHRVLMVGDGVNDTLSFSKAFVSVAMGAGGSEAAIEAADIALLRDDLRDLIFLRRLSRQSLRVVEQNFWMATFTNILGIALGATGALPPVLAGVLHVSHTLGIMINSGWLLHWDGPEGEFP